MKLDTFRRLDSHDRRLRQLERVEATEGMELDDLDDVDLSSSPPNDDDSLIWRAATSLWTPGKPPLGSWQTPAFNTGWGNFAVHTVARYRLLNDGRTVYLEGSVTRSSGSATLIFTFPTGYRPNDASSVHHFPVTATSAFGRVTVDGAGLVSLAAGTATGLVSLAGILFVT